VGITTIGINFIIKILAQRQIGMSPALKSKMRLELQKVYMELLDTTSALLFSLPYFLSFLPIIHFEEKDLLEKYGEEYQEYRKKVPYRLIPKII